MKPRAIVVILFYMTFFGYFVDGKNCVTSSPCSCDFDDGTGTIDISSIGVTSGTALIQDMFANDGFAYSYNPCFGFTEGSCSNVAACQLDAVNVVYYDIGDSTQATFSYDGQNIVVDYDSSDLGRHTKVRYSCDPSATSPVTTVKGETTPGNYEFSISTKVVCLAGIPINPGTTTVTVSTSISVGTVICILLVTVAVSYLLLGVTINRFARKRIGREQIPNYEQWVAVYVLVKNGCVFVIQKFRRRDQNYDNI